MKVVIDSVLRISEVPDVILQQVKTELTLRNPEYIKKKAMGLNRYAWGAELIKLWSEKDIDGVKEYTLPRGYYARLWEVAEGKFVIEDRRARRPFIDFPGSPNLRDYQSPAVELAEPWQQGVILMPCGAGKTETALGVVASIGQPTLWITHTMDLLQQSMDRAVSRLGLTGNQVGIIQGKNMSIGSYMTFATVQTLSKRDLSRVRDLFGCIVIDECHLVFKDAGKARMFESVISQFQAFYRFGVTASEHRSDGLIDTMFHVIGPKIYEIKQGDPRLPVMSPKVEFIETNFQYEVETYEELNQETGEMEEKKEMLNVKQLVSSMREDPDRTNIIKHVLEFKVTPKDYCICLGESLEFLQELQDSLLQLGRKAAFVCGTTPKKQRDKIMADMRAGRYQYMFATYQLAKLGLDVPQLNKILLATPMKDKTSIQQAVGRVMRPADGKEPPVVYDIYDKNVPKLVHWARDRVRVYKSLGAQINGGPRVRK